MITIYSVTLAFFLVTACQPGPVQKLPAELAGHAILPANTLVSPPADAPDTFKISGKFAAPDQVRRNKLHSIKGSSYISPADNIRLTNLDLPLPGQPIQGFSGIRAINENEYWAASDNGFGSKKNSPDALLVFYRLYIDWASGTVQVKEKNYLHDPGKVIPFHIVNEGTSKRYLTGADLDIESIQPVADSFYFGDEFGPYLLRTDRSGRVTGFWQASLNGKVLKSPDHFQVSSPSLPGGRVKFSVQRSRGFEAMALDPGKKFLYPALEGPMWVDGVYQKASNQAFVSVLQFDLEKEKFTGKSFRYYLASPSHNLGDFNLFKKGEGLVIERDNGEGDARHSCHRQAPPCFEKPARFKAVYHVRFEKDQLKKIAMIDLLQIADPGNKNHLAEKSKVFSFPFITIENVDLVAPGLVIVANDNNLGFSSGRRFDKNDDNEFVLLKVPGLGQ